MQTFHKRMAFSSSNRTNNTLTIAAGISPLYALKTKAPQLPLFFDIPDALQNLTQSVQFVFLAKKRRTKRLRQ